MTPAHALLPLGRDDLNRTVIARFDEVVRANPEHLALSCQGRSWTYAALDRWTNAVARAVANAISAHPRAAPIACLADHSAEMVVACLAAMKAGHPYYAVHPKLPALAMRHQWQQVSPAAIITTAGHRERANALAADAATVITLVEATGHETETRLAIEPLPTDPAAVFFTTGTTGTPTLTVRSHRTAMHRLWLATSAEAFTSTDRISMLKHAAFSAAQTDMFQALANGARLCIFDIVAEGLSRFARWINTEGLTVLNPPVAFFRRFLEALPEDVRFPSVRVVGLGGDAVRPHDLEMWKRHFVRPSCVLNRLSSTETGLLTIGRHDHDTPATADALASGWPVADKRLSIVDADGQPVTDGREGLLKVESLFLSDRTVHVTGDRARQLPDGRVMFLGRDDHQVKVRGYRVSTSEVEATLNAAPGVAESAVVVAHRHESPELVAYVVWRAPRADAGAGPADTRALAQWMVDRLPDWKRPAQIHAIDALPLTLNGKVDRRALLAQAQTAQARPLEAAAAPLGDTPVGAVERAVADAWTTVLGRAPTSRTADLFASGADSLQAAMLHLRLERQFEVELPIDVLMALPTVAKMAQCIEGVLRDAARATDPRGANSRGLVGRRPRSLLVPLKRTGSRPPLFLVHGRPGRAFAKPHILDALGVDQPVYTFQASGLDQQRLARYTIETMADAYRAAAQRVAPSGPYVLGGVCAGGLIAVAMALRLQASGHHVAPLLLIDPPATLAGELPWWRRWRRMVRSRLRLARASGDAATQGEVAFELARLRHRGWRYDAPVFMLRSSDRLSHDQPHLPRALSAHLTGVIHARNVGAAHRDVQRAGNPQLVDALKEWSALVRSDLGATSARP